MGVGSGGSGVELQGGVEVGRIRGSRQWWWWDVGVRSRQ